MKKIIRYFKISLLASIAFMASSCLKGNLEDIPEFEDAEITGVSFEFRYKDPTDLWIDGEPIVKYVNLTVGNQQIDKEAGTISCTLAVPAAAAPFTDDIRSTVSLSSIVGKVNLSTAATIAPANGSPKLGVPGDFSAPRQYVVTAANGSTKTWTISVTALNK